MALTLDEKPVLYFSKQYLNPKQSFLDRIEETGVFSHVVGITGRGEFVKFIADLQKTEHYTPEQVDEVGTSIFDKHLEPYYAELFADADFNDTIYVYNDFQWHFYYINKHFNDIVGVEDGYASLRQQLKVHQFKGDHELALKFMDKYYPKPLYQSPKIKKIISSCDFPDIPEEYKSRLEIIEYNELIHRNYEAFQKALLYIFDIEDFEIKDGSILFLGQPLSRAQYCLPGEEYLFNKKLVRRAAKGGKHIYYKPHPADTISAFAYEDEYTHILPQRFPVEILNYKGCTFDTVLSFGSTGVNTLTCAKESETIYKNQNATPQEIKDYIKKSVKKQRIIIDFYCVVRALTTDAFINVFSCLLPRVNLKMRAHVIVPPQLYEQAQEFFGRDIKEMIAAYRADHMYKDVCVYDDYLELLAQRSEKLAVRDIITCGQIDDEEELFKVCAHHEEKFDFLMLVEEKNLMFSPTKNISVTLNQMFNLAIEMNRGDKKHGSCGMGIWETVLRYNTCLAAFISSI